MDGHNDRDQRDCTENQINRKYEFQPFGTLLGTVQALLGHASSEITRQVYLHSLPQDRRVAAEKLEAHLFGPKLDPNSSWQECALPESVGAEEVIGRGDRI